MRFLKKDYNRAQVIDFYFDKIKIGELEFSVVRKELTRIGIEESEINIVTKQIDNQIMRYDILKAEHNKGKNLFYGGLLLALVGFIISIITFFNLVNFGNVFIFAYGPLFGGLITAMKGKSMMNRF
jgi:hypothetical protein